MRNTTRFANLGAVRRAPTLSFGFSLLLAGLAWSAGQKLAENPAPNPAAQDNRVLLDGWTYSRERKTLTGSNRVTARLALRNVSAEALEDVRVELTLFSGLGEKVAGPLTQKLGAVKPKESKPLQFVAEFVPIFGAYQVQISYRDGKETWHSSSDLGNPEPKSEQLLENTSHLVVLGEESGPDRSNRLAGSVRVKNEGKLEAKNMTLKVTYFGAPSNSGAKRGAKLGEWSAPLAGVKLAGGEVKNIPFTVPTPIPKGMGTYEIRVLSEEAPLEQQLSGGEFQNLKDLEAAHWRFKRSGPKGENLEVVCDVRNGLSQPVEGAKLTLTLFTSEKGQRKMVKSHAQEVPGPLAPGAVVPVSFTVLQIPAYDSYEQAWEYGKSGAGASTAAKAQEPAFKGEATVEILFKSFTTLDDGTVQVVCQARNGRPCGVKEIEVKLHFQDASGKELCVAEKLLPDPVAAGDVRNFLMRVTGAKGYANYTSEVKFQEFKPEAPVAPAP